MAYNQNLHLIYTPFTGVGLHGGFRGDKWLKHRIEIFKNYTLKSLQNQTNKEFLHWITFRQEESGNLLVEDLIKFLSQSNYRSIITFEGLMYHDDKFNNYNLKTILRNIAMMVWDGIWYKEFKSPLKIIK